MSKTGYNITLVKAYRDHKQHFQTYPVHGAEKIHAQACGILHHSWVQIPTNTEALLGQMSFLSGPIPPISAGLSGLLTQALSTLPSGLKCLLKFLNVSCSPNFLSLFLYMLHQL